MPMSRVGKKSRFLKNKNWDFFLFKSDWFFLNLNQIFFKNCPESSISSWKIVVI